MRKAASAVNSISIVALSFVLLQSIFVNGIFQTSTLVKPVGATTNLVRNGDFSQGLSYWTSTVARTWQGVQGPSYPIFTIERDAQNNNYPSLAIDAPNNSDGYVEQAVSIPQSPNVVLSFQTWGHHDPVSAIISIIDQQCTTHEKRRYDPTCKMDFDCISPETVNIDLTEFNGQAIRIRFEVTSPNGIGAIGDFANISITAASPTDSNDTSRQRSPPIITVFRPTIDDLSVSINGVALPTSADAKITKILWNWNDGETTVGWFPQNHTYIQGGTYNIVVTAFDTNELSTSASLVAILQSKQQTSSTTTDTTTSQPTGTTTTVLANPTPSWTSPVVIVLVEGSEIILRDVGSEIIDGKICKHFQGSSGTAIVCGIAVGSLDSGTQGYIVNSLNSDDTTEPFLNYRCEPISARSATITDCQYRQLAEPPNMPEKLIPFMKAALINVLQNAAGAITAPIVCGALGLVTSETLGWAGFICLAIVGEGTSIGAGYVGDQIYEEGSSTPMSLEQIRQSMESPSSSPLSSGSMNPG